MGNDDPYLKELDDSMEDILAEEPTRFDIPLAEKEPHLAAKAPLKEPRKKAAKAQGLSAAEVKASPASDPAAGLAAALPVQVRVVVAERQGTLAELIELKKGEIMTLEKGLDAAVDLMVHDKVVASGELVQIEGRLGVRITRVITGE